MAELLMGCEEELEQWQKKLKEIEDDHHELIYVGEIAR